MSKNSDKEQPNGSNKTNSAWGGRFQEPTNKFVERFNASVSFDQRLYKHDIAGSIAHTQMLAKVGVLTTSESQAIVSGLSSIEQQIESGQFNWLTAREDVHMNIEAMLTDNIGEVGKKLHTGRSRNDQVATDIRLYLRDAIDQIIVELTRLQTGLVTVAERESATIMPGFTHLQTAQPVTFGHHMLAWNEMLERDYGRLMDCKSRLNFCPLGAAALAGTTYPIDRAFTASQLGFEAPTNNSLDSVSDRDFAIEFNSAASILMMHLSRMSEELILWASSQFDFIELPDRFCTGSSIMPQKKNPDVPELVRGKSARVFGHLMSLLSLMKSQPLAYNKDNQEDKEPLFDTIDTLLDCLKAYADMVPAMQAKKENLYQAASKGFATATDLADYLVRQGLPFRDSHSVVGKAVALCIERNCELAELPLPDLKAFSTLIEEDVYSILTLEGSVAARNHLGGTAPDQVKAACSLAKLLINKR